MKTLLEKDVKWNYNPAWSLDVASRQVWDSAVLGFKAKGVWGYMSSKPRGWKFSAERIANDSSDGRKSVLAAMQQLVDAGYLNRSKDGTGRMTYVISDEAYVGIEPRVELSPLEGLGMRDEREIVDIYSGDTGYRVNGVIQTQGPVVEFNEPNEFVCTNDAIEELKSEGWTDGDARKACMDWNEACEECDLPQTQATWRKWKKHILLALGDHSVVKHYLTRVVS
jgi:hypothetical protein